MDYENILVEPSDFGVRIILNRPEDKNSLNSGMVRDLSHVFTELAKDDELKMVTLEGNSQVFCSGMDFKEASSGSNAMFSDDSDYMTMMRKIALLPKLLVCWVEGQVTAGGMGLVGVADWVIASPGASFALSEALWGLMPAMVTPYLIRRIGFQKAYQMTLTTLPMLPDQAKEIGLADEIAENPIPNLRRLFLRVRRLESETIGDIKAYFREMWIIDQAMEDKAVAKISSLVSKPRVKENISNFLHNQTFPWDKK